MFIIKINIYIYIKLEVRSFPHKSSLHCEDSTTYNFYIFPNQTQSKKTKWVSQWNLWA